MEVPLEHRSDPILGLHEAFFRHTHGLLEAAAGPGSSWQSARECLETWGFRANPPAGLAVGFFPSVELVRQRLLHDGFTPEELRQSHLLGDPRLEGRLVGPIRDWTGRIRSFWARHPRQLGPRCLYLNKQWKEQTAVFGLDVALGVVAEGRQDLVLVEDLLDALLLHSHGLRHVAAIGGPVAEMTAARWERLAELGVYRVTLAPDHRPDWDRALLLAVGTAARARIAPAVYVLPPQWFSEARGPADMMRAHGPETLNEYLVKQRLHGYQYKALSLVMKHKGNGPWTDGARQAVVAEAVRFYGLVNQANVPQLNAFFLPPLLQELGLDWDEFPAWRERAWAEESAAPDTGEWIELAQGPAVLAPEAVLEEASPPVVESPVVQASVPVVVEPVPASELAPALPPARVSRPRRPATPEFCEFHQCDRIVCLCWD